MIRSEELTSFAWTVAKDGYRWIESAAAGSSHKDRYLSTGVPIGTTYPRWRYNPLAHTALFRDFAEVPLTEDGMLGFANKWGPLGGTATVPVGVKSVPEKKAVLLGDGESARFWFSEIRDMKELVELWDMTSQGDPRLGERIEWGENRVIYIGPRVPGFPPNSRSRAEIAQASHSPEVFNRFVRGDLALPALHYIQKCVNDKLTKHNVSARLLWDSHHQHLGMYLVPASLIGCLWFQFARAIDGERKYNRCPICRKWFETTSTVSRSDRVFCSPSCKAGNHRKKIAEARKMHANGLSPKKIAQMLDTSVKSVNGWLKG